MGLIGSAVNTLTLGALGSRDPQPVVLRYKNGAWVPEQGYKESTQYDKQKAFGVAAATVGGMGIVGLGQAARVGFNMASEGVMSRVVGSLQTAAVGATLLGVGLVGTNLVQSDKVKLIFKNTYGDTIRDSTGHPFERTIDRSTYNQFLAVPR